MDQKGACNNLLLGFNKGPIKAAIKNSCSAGIKVTYIQVLYCVRSQLRSPKTLERRQKDIVVENNQTSQLSM
jgi:hypothetical protein